MCQTAVSLSSDQMATKYGAVTAYELSWGMLLGSGMNGGRQY